MKDNLTEIVCVIDRSGSMQAVRSDAIGGFNSFIEEQKKVPGGATLTVVLFNHEYEFLHRCVALEGVKLDGENYVPGGTTALLDAVGRTIDDVGNRLSNTSEADRPGKVIVTILTDGLENASKDYTRNRINEMIKHQREKYGWEFVFLAANQDAFAEGASMGIPRDTTMAFAATPEGTKGAWSDTSRTVSRLRTNR